MSVAEVTLVSLHPLVQRIQAGQDDDAWNALVGALDGPARRAARLVTGDQAVAEDAVQDAWVQVLQRISDFAFPQGIDDRAKDLSVVGWVLTIVRRVAADHAERAARHRRLPPPKRLATPMRMNTPLPELAVAAMRSALDELESTTRRLLHLRFTQGLSYIDIAREIGGTAANARLQVHRALRRLGRRLGREPAALAILLWALAPAWSKDASDTPPSDAATDLAMTTVTAPTILALASLFLVASVACIAAGQFAIGSTAPAAPAAEPELLLDWNPAAIRAAARVMDIGEPMTPGKRDAPVLDLPTGTLEGGLLRVALDRKHGLIVTLPPEILTNDAKHPLRMTLHLATIPARFFGYGLVAEMDSQTGAAARPAFLGVPERIEITVRRSGTSPQGAALHTAQTVLVHHHAKPQPLGSDVMRGDGLGIMVTSDALGISRLTVRRLAADQ